jgi:glutathione S-transferase
MRLYYAPGTISIAVAITLEEAALPYEAIKVDFKSAEQTKSDYLALNPKGRVPTLEVDGEMLTETGALLDYIATRAPDAGLVPDDPLEAAKMRSVMYYLASTMHVNHAHKMRGHRWADRPESHADMAAKVPQTMAESARYIAEHALRGDFILGDRFSLADPYCFVVCNWLEADKVDLGSFPTIAAYLDRMRARPSVQTVIAKGMLPG